MIVQAKNHNEEELRIAKELLVQEDLEVEDDTEEKKLIRLVMYEFEVSEQKVSRSVQGMLTAIDEKDREILRLQKEVRSLREKNKDK